MKKKLLKIFLLIILSLFLIKNVFSAPICKSEKITITKKNGKAEDNKINEIEEETENKNISKKDEEGNSEEKCVAGNDLGATFNADNYVKTFFKNMELNI